MTVVLISKLRDIPMKVKPQPTASFLRNFNLRGWLLNKSALISCLLFIVFLGPYLEQTVPTSSAQSQAIKRNLKAAYTVVMTLQVEDSFSLQCIPYIAVEIIIASKQVSSRDGKVNRGDAT